MWTEGLKKIGVLPSDERDIIVEKPQERDTGGIQLSSRAYGHVAVLLEQHAELRPLQSYPILFKVQGGEREAP